MPGQLNGGLAGCLPAFHHVPCCPASVPLPLTPSLPTAPSRAQVTGDTTAEVYSPVSLASVCSQAGLRKAWLQAQHGHRGGKQPAALPAARPPPQTSPPPPPHRPPFPPALPQPYLFRGPRPVISSASDAIRQGEDLVVHYTSAAPVTKALLIRTSATTHSMPFGEGRVA